MVKIIKVTRPNPPLHTASLWEALSSNFLNLSEKKLELLLLFSLHKIPPEGLSIAGFFIFQSQYFCLQKL